MTTSPPKPVRANERRQQHLNRRFSWARAIAQGFSWMIIWLGGMFVFHVAREGTVADAVGELGLSSWRAPIIYAVVAGLTGVAFELIRLWSERKDRPGREKPPGESPQDE